MSRRRAPGVSWAIPVFLILPHCVQAEPLDQVPSVAAELPRADGGGPAQGSPEDPCTVPWRFDAQGRLISMPSECAFEGPDTSDPADAVRGEHAQVATPVDGVAPNAAH
jgi:hypothetical protein